MLGKTNSSVGSKINNMDLFVTDNGVYSAPDGFTGLGIVEVNVPKGEQVTAINKTGAMITSGSKVWLNENQQTQGSSYSIENSATSTPYYASGVLSRTGQWAWRKGGLFSIGADSAIKVSDFSSYAVCVKYGADGSVFLMGDNSSTMRSYRVDEIAQYTYNGRFLGEDYFINSSDNSTIVQVNLSDGTVIKTLGKPSSYTPACMFKINDCFYALSTSSAIVTKYKYNGESFEQSSISSNSVGMYPIDVTTDKRYVIGAMSPNYSNYSSGTQLRILEVIDEDNLHMLTQAEMPADLQEYYSAEGFFTFNPYTGILTAVKRNSTDYVVMKYENGYWTKLPIDLGVSEPLKGSLTLSDDLTRCSIAYGSTGSWYAYIINLETTSGYSAVPYRFYNVNENTITGYAGNDTEPDMEVIVGVGSVPSVNNGGSYEPTTPPLEEAVLDSNYIDTNKVLSVGRVFQNEFNIPTAMDYATLSEDSGAIVYSDGSFNSEDKLVADEFVMKFYFSDRVGNEFMKSQFVYLFGHNTASDGGNWWDETDRSNQFSIAFGFDSEWNYRTFGVNVGFLDENGLHSPNTKVDIGGELPFGWNTIKMYYNNDIQMWCLAFGDNYANEYSIPELPKVCKPYNLNAFIENAGYGDNCIDLAETGFKLNGEWVWRAVK
jgi:hypothetical protein